MQESAISWVGGDAREETGGSPDSSHAGRVAASACNIVRAKTYVGNRWYSDVSRAIKSAAGFRLDMDWSAWMQHG